MRPVESISIKRVLDHAAETPDLPIGPVVDGAVSPAAPSLAPAAPAALTTYEGMGGGLAGYSVNVAPPDTEGAVGKNYFVQAVNSDLAVFDKSTGAVVFGPVTLVSLWQGFPSTDGNRCAKNNDGDPIIYYDQLADRWVVSQFDVTRPSGATSDYQCLAVSTSGDPTGTWYRWDYVIPSGLMGDYEKIGLWPDGYYMTIRGFSGTTGSFQGSRLLVFDRSKLLVGAPDAVQLDSGFLGNLQDGFTPMSLDGFTPPPPGAAGAVAKWSGTTAIRFYWAKVNSNADGTWNASPTLTITGPQDVTVNPFTSVSGAQVPQPGTTTKLDTLGNNLMYRLAYRNFGTPASPDERLVVNHSVAGSNGAAVAFRWYEFKNNVIGTGIGPTNAPVVAQQETFSPNGTSRWMASIAEDRRKNIGVGYSIASSTVYAGMAFSGRRPTDPAGLQGETVAQAGSDFQTIDGTNSNTTDLIRWGDYSQTSVDPIDDCTFWHTNEYLATEVPLTHAFDWHTAITKFRYSDCPVCTAPATPTGITVVANSSTSYTVAWAASSNAGSYSVYRNLAACPGGTPIRIATCPGSAGCAASNLAYTDTSAIAGTTYYYSVTAIDAATSGCESIRSTCVSSATGSCVQDPSFAGVTSVSPYTIVNGGVIVNNSCSLHISWAAGSTNCPDNPGITYNVYRSTASGGPYTNIKKCVSSLYYDDTAVAGGTTYYYVVRAEDSSSGNGGTCNGGNEDRNTVQLSGAPGNFANIYYENFDSTSTGSVPNCGAKANCSGGWAESGNWVGARQCSPTYSSPNVVHFGNSATPDCVTSYPSGASNIEDTLTSPTITVPAGYTNTRLSIWHRWNFYGSVYDGGKVVVSVAGGAFVEIPSSAFVSGGYTANQSSARRNADGCTAWAGGTNYSGTGIWGGQQNSMVNTVVNLDGICGGTCASKTLVFQFVGISNCTATTDKGWYVDDIQVLGSSSSTCSTPASGLQVLTTTATSGQALVQLRTGATGSRVHLRYSTTAFPVGPNDGLPVTGSFNGGVASTSPFGVATTSNDNVLVTGLANGTSYYYSAFADTGAGTAASGGISVSATPALTGTSTGSTAWMFNTSAASLTPPAMNGGLFVVSNDRNLHSVGPTSAGGSWPGTWTPFLMNGVSQGRPNSINTSFAYPIGGGANPVVFMGAQDGNVYAVNGTTGSQIWKNTTPVPAQMIQASPMYFGHTYGGNSLPKDLVIVGTRNSSGNNEVFAMDAATGSVLWEYIDSNLGMINGPVVFDTANRNVFFASRAKTPGASTLWSIHFDSSPTWSATLRWSKALGDIDGAPNASGSRLYVGNNLGQVYALDYNGTFVWTSLAGNYYDTTDGPVKSFISADFATNSQGNTNLYFATTNKVWALGDQGTTAVPSWTLGSTNGVKTPSAPVFTGTYVLFGSSDGSVFEVTSPRTATPTTNSILLRANAVVGSPTFNTNANLIYAGTDAGTIYAVTPK